MTNSTPFSRRSVLKGAGVAGTIGLAGCTGNNGTDPGSADGSSPSDGDSGGSDSSSNELVLGTAPDVSALNAMHQALAAAISENATDFSLDVRPSETTSVNIGKLARDEVDIGLIQALGAQMLREGEEPFGDMEVDLQLIAHSASTDWFLIAENPDITSVEDLQDKVVFPGSAGGAVHEIVTRCLSFVDVEYEERNIAYPDIGSAMSEGRIDVSVAANNNVAINPTTPGWVQQAQGSLDAHILEVPTEIQEDINNEPELFSISFDPANPDGWTNIPDPVRSFSTVTAMVGTSETSHDAVSALMNTMYEMRDELGEYHNLLGYYENDEHWTNYPYEGYGYHPAAADFYQENDMWSDELERAE